MQVATNKIHVLQLAGGMRQKENVSSVT